MDGSFYLLFCVLLGSDCYVCPVMLRVLLVIILEKSMVETEVFLA
jgi:hypothetical protein